MAIWPLLRYVNQRSLMSCRIELEDRPLDRAGLFPLFDDGGQTRVLMITAEETGRILLADWSPGVFVRNWSRRNRLRLRFADLNDAAMWDEGRFEDLWHFDPWWVLGEERYHGHPSVPALRGTNIPGHDESVSAMVFDRGLGRATHVVTRTKDSAAVHRVTAETFAAAGRRRRAATERPRKPVESGWRLRPFWRVT